MRPSGGGWGTPPRQAFLHGANFCSGWARFLWCWVFAVFWGFGGCEASGDKDKLVQLTGVAWIDDYYDDTLGFPGEGPADRPLRRRLLGKQAVAAAYGGNGGAFKH
jgi:hypothetical protein